MADLPHCPRLWPLGSHALPQPPSAPPPRELCPSPRKSKPRSPSLTAPGGEQRAREGGRRRAARARLTQRPLLPGPPTRLRGAEARGVAPAGSPSPARHPGPPSARLPAAARCRRGVRVPCQPLPQSPSPPAEPGPGPTLASVGCQFPSLYWRPFFSENEYHQLGIIPTLNQNTVETVIISDSDELIPGQSAMRNTY